MLSAKYNVGLIQEGGGGGGEIRKRTLRMRIIT